MIRNFFIRLLGGFTAKAFYANIKCVREGRDEEVEKLKSELKTLQRMFDHNQGIWEDAQEALNDLDGYRINQTANHHLIRELEAELSVLPTYKEIAYAVENLMKVRGRHNTSKAYERLEEVYQQYKRGGSLPSPTPALVASQSACESCSRDS